jgi:hypothetical protein
MQQTTQQTFIEGRQRSQERRIGLGLGLHKKRWYLQRQLIKLSCASKTPHYSVTPHIDNRSSQGSPILEEKSTRLQERAPPPWVDRYRFFSFID